MGGAILTTLWRAWLSRQGSSYASNQRSNDLGRGEEALPGFLGNAGARADRILCYRYASNEEDETIVCSP